MVAGVPKLKLAEAPKFAGAVVVVVPKEVPNPKAGVVGDPNVKPPPDGDAPNTVLLALFG